MSRRQLVGKAHLRLSHDRLSGAMPWRVKAEVRYLQNGPRSRCRGLGTLGAYHAEVFA